jgi:hypothetical protein
MTERGNDASRSNELLFAQVNIAYMRTTFATTRSKLDERRERAAAAVARASAMPKPSTIATRRWGRSTAAGETIRRRDLFNLEGKSSCRFSADAGRGIAPCNSWLIGSKGGARMHRSRRRRATRTALVGDLAPQMN